MVNYNIGIDIGSVSAKIVVIDPKSLEIITSKVIPTGYDTNLSSKKLLDLVFEELGISNSDIDMTNVVSTGYSRKNVDYSTRQITEISCQAKGIHHLFPSAHTIIDIGGQDSKVIKIDDNGRMIDFEMNDKCSAGTGRFLEVMANALELKLEEMEILASEAKTIASISSTCTVFAESEVISRIAQGTNREDIVAGIHESIATKIYSLVSRVGLTDDIVLTGGVAFNKGVVKCLNDKIGSNLLIPKNPQITGALGASLFSVEERKKDK